MTESGTGAAAGRGGPDGLRAAGRAMQILFALAAKPGGVSLTDLARDTGLTLTTVHRMIGTLRQHRMTRETMDGLQALGPGTLILARGFLGGLDFRVEALPVLSELRETTSEACHLATLASPHVVYVDKLDSNHAVRVSTRIGATAPAVRTALGRAMLAFSPESAAESVIEASRAQLGIDGDGIGGILADTRARGYAVDLGENETGVSCVAAPVFDDSGSVIAAIDVAVPGVRLHEERLDELGALVRRSADAISTALGHHGGEHDR